MNTSGSYAAPTPVIDRETACWTTTAGGTTVFTGTIRHDDDLPTPGWVLFDQNNTPVPSTTPGLTFVTCEAEDFVTEYQTESLDVTGAAPQTFAPTGDMISWTARNRNATTATIRVNGGQVLPLDNAETIGASLTGHDINDVLTDTFIINPGDGSVRVTITRRV